MKKLLIYAGLIFSLGIGLTSCYKDIIKPTLADDPEGPPKQVSFKNDLAPIFNTKCATGGCHTQGAPGTHRPYLSTDIAYTQIMSGGFVNLSVPKESILYKNVYGEMAQYIPAAKDKQKVYDWIRNGAPNN